MENNKDLFNSLVKCQLEIKAPKKDKYNSHLKYYYSSLDAIYESIRLPLANNGLCLSHTVEHEDQIPYLFTMIHHVNGGMIKNRMPLIIGKSDSQGLGMALTYSRKYAICSLLALPTEDDSDGEKEMEAAPKESNNPKSYNSLDVKLNVKSITLEKAEELERLIGLDIEYKGKLLDWLKINSFLELPENRFQSIKTAIEKHNSEVSNA